MSNNEERLRGLTFHLVPREYYEAQPPDRPYLPEPMATGREAFIHCTDGVENLAATGNRFYQADPREFVALVVDLERLTAPARYEDPGQIFPHIYGPLDREAILAVRPVPRDPDGRFQPLPNE